MRNAKPTIALSIVFVAILVLVSCSGAPTSQPTTPGQSPTQAPTTGNTAQVSIKDFQFSPAALTVKKGTTVTWTNEDSVAHDVANDATDSVSAGQLFKSKPLAKGESFSFTFDQAGEYPYHCPIHPAMKARVVVEE